MAPYPTHVGPSLLRRLWSSVGTSLLSPLPLAGALVVFLTVCVLCCRWCCRTGVGASTVSRVVGVTVATMTPSGAGSQGRGAPAESGVVGFMPVRAAARGAGAASRLEGTQVPGRSPACLAPLTALPVPWTCRVLEVPVPVLPPCRGGSLGLGAGPCLHGFPSPPTSRRGAVWNPPASWWVPTSGSSVDLWMFYWS